MLDGLLDLFDRERRKGSRIRPPRRDTHATANRSRVNDGDGPGENAPADGWRRRNRMDYLDN